MKAKWKSHINILNQIPMEECIVHIKLAQKLAFHSSHNQQAFPRNHLSNRAEGFNIIQALFLCEPCSNQPGFIPLYRPIIPILNSINPLTTNCLLVRWKRGKGLGMICLQCCNFNIHGSLPFRVRHSLRKVLWFNNGRY